MSLLGWVDPAQLDPEFSHDLYLYHPPYLFFSFLSVFCGGASSCSYRLFCSKLLATQLGGFRFKPRGIFLLFCWLGKKKLILVSVFLAIWRPKKTLKKSFRNEETRNLLTLWLLQVFTWCLLVRQCDSRVVETDWQQFPLFLPPCQFQHSVEKL